jgi:hypothetical protein
MILKLSKYLCKILFLAIFLNFKFGKIATNFDHNIDPQLCQSETVFFFLRLPKPNSKTVALVANRSSISVTRFGEFSEITNFGRFLENYKPTDQKFSRKALCTNFYKKMFGVLFLAIFPQNIWSPCLPLPFG